MGARNSMDGALAADLATWASQRLSRILRQVQDAAGPEISIDGRWVVHFASNDYLGLSQHPALKQAAETALANHGSGSAASRLNVGSLRCHHQLEECRAEFTGTPAALAFSSGYSAALGVIPALVGRGEYVVLDWLVHACCVDAAKLSGANLRVFPHNDVQALDTVLQRIRSHGDSSTKPARILVVTEGVFSMDGDIIDGQIQGNRRNYARMSTRFIPLVAHISVENSNSGAFADGGQQRLIEKRCRSPAEARKTLDRYLKADLLIIDDMGIKALPEKSGEVLLEVILRRYETRSTMMTSNRPIEEWGKLLHDAAAATAILDGLLHHAELIQLTGKSYRLEQAARRAKKTAG